MNTETTPTTLFEVTEGVNNDATVHKGFVFSLIAWYLVLVPKGKYRLKVNGELLDSSFSFSGTPSNWVYMRPTEIEWNMSWNEGPLDVSLVREGEADPTTYSLSRESTNKGSNRFLIAVRRRDQVYVPERVERLLSSKCLSVVAQSCPINPVTKLPMTHCLAWRRTDGIGSQCQSSLTYEEMNESIKTFCTRSYEDCYCVNRDFCREERCKRGWYLVLNQRVPVQCSRKTECTVSYSAGLECELKQPDVVTLPPRPRHRPDVVTLPPRPRHRPEDRDIEELEPTQDVPSYDIDDPVTTTVAPVPEKQEINVVECVYQVTIGVLGVCVVVLGFLLYRSNRYM